MRLSIKIISTMTFAALLVFTLDLFASETATPSTTIAANESSSDSSFALAIDPAGSLTATIPDASMAPATPYSGGRDIYYPKIELFLGYSYLRAVPAPSNGNRLVWLNGGSTSVAFNLSRYFGIAEDFGDFNDSRLELRGPGAPSTVVGSSGNVFTYLLGPRFSYRKHDRFIPFAQAQLGLIHASEVTASSGCTGAGCTLLPSETRFALAAGGGLDLRLHHHLAVRVVQAEYLMTRFDDLSTGSTATQNDIRLSTGLVFRFGGGPRTPTH
jgi:opacity protein-like surface antigen